MKVGVVQHLKHNTDFESGFARMQDLGISSCQLISFDRKLFHTPGAADRILASMSKYNITATAFWCGWEGRNIWDFYEGPITLGLVPVDTRYERLLMLMEGSDFAKKLGIRNLVTHAGFIPENPLDPNYPGLLNACKSIAEHCVSNGQVFLFETGQETPLTLKRVIQDIEKVTGPGTVGVNLDPANLIIYGKGNPVDAIDVFGSHILGVHGKDAVYSNDGYRKGKEVPLGQGKANFPVLIRRLQEIGYCGDITIEREISGEQKLRDIQAGKAYLEMLISEREAQKCEYE